MGKKESDIKTASAKLAGSKSKEARAKFGMKKGGELLSRLTTEESQLFEEKANSDDALREAAKQMKANKELDGKILEERKRAEKESGEKQLVEEGHGKEAVNKANIALKEKENKEEKASKEGKEKQDQQKAEVNKKIEVRLAQQKKADYKSKE